MANWSRDFPVNGMCRPCRAFPPVCSQDVTNDDDINDYDINDYDINDYDINDYDTNNAGCRPGLDTPRVTLTDREPAESAELSGGFPVGLIGQPVAGTITGCGDPRDRADPMGASFVSAEPSGNSL